MYDTARSYNVVLFLAGAVINGEDSGRGSSIGGGKSSSDAQSLKQPSPSKNGLQDRENNAMPPADQGGSSGNSGGGEDDPPKKHNKKSKEDETEEESSEDDDDDAKYDQVDITLKETESNTYEGSCVLKNVNTTDIENGHEANNEDDEDVKPNIEELKLQGSQLNGGPIRKARGRPRKHPIQTDASGNPINKARPYKKREPKKYKPRDIVRRKRKIKKENEEKPSINLARQKYLESLKNKESSSWDKEVEDTLQNVIKTSRKSKKFKAIGRPRKRPLEEGEKMVKTRKKREKKVKLGVMAYPIVEIKKKSENDWDTVEAKYEVPGFCCNDCGAVYQSTAALRRHQNYECGKEPQFKCDECDYAAKHKGTLKSHIKNRHLPKNDPEDSQKKPRKPRKPRVLLIPRAPSPI